MKTPVAYPVLRACPPQFFMSARDLAFWVQSARADAVFARLERAHGIQEAFERLYAQTGDPWGFANPRYRYQRLKYEKMLSYLPARPYATALDIGCGIGGFTRLLAPYVGSVLGVEVAAAGVREARRLSEGAANVRYEQGDLLSLRALPDCWSDKSFSLIVLADVLYYLSPLTQARLDGILADVAALLELGGIVLLVNHYFFEQDAQSRLVRRIHTAFCEAASFRILHQARQPFFLATVLQKR